MAEDADGVPLVFLGQICFMDSQDILPFKPPGDVALIFGKNYNGWISVEEGGALEWSSRELRRPEDGLGVPLMGRLPFSLHGVLHRTLQYTDDEVCETVLKGVGYKEGGWRISSMQATLISTHANLPQGWPFERGDGNTLVGVLSSFYFSGEWPLCDVPRAIVSLDAEGRGRGAHINDAITFGVGDAGCIWIYRDKNGEFKMDEAGG